MVYNFYKYKTSTNIRVRGGNPNGVMKLPGRVMAGGVVLAGGFLFFCSPCAAASGPQPDPRPTRDPPATHPLTTREKNNEFSRNRAT